MANFTIVIIISRSKTIKSIIRNQDYWVCQLLNNIAFENEDGILALEFWWFKFWSQSSFGIPQEAPNQRIWSKLSFSSRFPQNFPPKCSDLPRRVFFEWKKNCDEDDNASDGWSEFWDAVSQPRWEIPVVLAEQPLQCTGTLVHYLYLCCICVVFVFFVCFICAVFVW